MWAAAVDLWMGWWIARYLRRGYRFVIEFRPRYRLWAINLYGPDGAFVDTGSGETRHDAMRRLIGKMRRSAWGRDGGQRPDGGRNLRERGAA